jgi:hypothetical protein
LGENFRDTFGFDVEDIAKEISTQTQSTKESDLGQTFLTLAMSLTRNKKIEPTIAKFSQDSMGQETFIFSLSDILTFVKDQGKRSEIAVSDEKTIAGALRAIGCEKKVSRDLTGTNKKVWSYIVPSTDESQE